MLHARCSDLIRILSRIEEDEDLPIYFLTGDRQVIPLSRGALIGGIVAPVGPVASLNIPKHIIIKCPREKR